MPETQVTTITLRRSKGADIPALQQLYRRSFSTALRGDYAPSAMVAALQALTRPQARLVDAGHYYLAVDEDDRILGAGGWSFAHPQGAPSPIHMAHVRHFAVDPSRTGQGIGSKLLRHAITEARQSGVKLIDAQSIIGAVPFFQAHGFRDLGQISVPVKPGLNYPAQRLQLRLA